MADFAELLGKTLTSVTNKDNDEIVFQCSDGTLFRQHHSQNCCESVRVEEIIGDLSDLVDTPILLAEESFYHNEPTPEDATDDPDEYCWTFYKLATVKGHVTVRWFGESNGNYSTYVSFEQVQP